MSRALRLLVAPMLGEDEVEVEGLVSMLVGILVLDPLAAPVVDVGAPSPE